MVTLTRHSSASFRRVEEFGGGDTAAVVVALALASVILVRMGEVSPAACGDAAVVAAEARAVAYAEGLVVIGEAGCGNNGEAILLFTV